MTPNALITAFFDLGLQLAARMAPYALHTLYALILLELTTIGITWMVGSNDDPPELLWRIVRLVFTGGFARWWILNSWVLGVTVMGSFDQIGRNIADTPGGLAPTAFFDVSIRIAKTLYDAPMSGHGIFGNIAASLFTGLILLTIVLLLGLLAAVAAFSLIATYLIIGPGSIFVAFMPCRFTTTLTEHYFVWLVRTGALLLGFYVVLTTCQQFAALWNTALTTACGPVSATLPVPFLGHAPTAVAAVPCTKAIPFDSLITLFFDVLLLAVVGLSLPFILASMAGNGVHLGLEHLASAKYLASGVRRGVSKGVSGLSHQIAKMRQSNSQRSTLEQRLTAGANAAASQSPCKAATQQLAKQTPINAFGVPRTKGLPGSNGANPTTKI